MECAMADDFDKLFMTDSSLERDGVIFYASPDTWVKLARAGGDNAKFTRIWEEKTRPYQAQITANVLSADIMARVIAETFAEAVVLEWSGITVDGVVNAPCTKENVIKKMLSNKNLA